MTDSTHIAESLRVAMARADLGRMALCDTAGVSPPTLAALLDGSGRVTAGPLERVCAALGLRIVVRLERSDE